MWTASSFRTSGAFVRWNSKAKAPVRLTERWYPHALFDHSKHQTATCDSCHEHMADSDDSIAIHMPGIANCRGCHGDGESRKVASTCLTCHAFHRPENELFQPKAPAPVSKVAASAEVAAAVAEAVR